jgi:hypothetical protein
MISGKKEILGHEPFGSSKVPPPEKPMHPFLVSGYQVEKLRKSVLTLLGLGRWNGKLRSGGMRMAPDESSDARPTSDTCQNQRGTRIVPG